MASETSWPTRLRLKPVVPVTALLSLTSLLSVLLATSAEPWGDERIAMRLLEQWSVWEVLTVLPTRQPHLPTWYLLPELAGWQATAAVSMVALPVTVYATARAGRVLYGSRPALAAASMVAGSPFLAEQAGWLRMYAPLTALMALGLWWTLDARHGRAAAAFVGAAVLHPFGWFGPVWMAGVTARDRPRLAAAVLAVASAPNSLLLLLNTSFFQQQLTAQTTHMTHGRVLTLIDMGLIPTFSLAGAFIPTEALPAIVVLSGLILYRSAPSLQLFVFLPILGISAASWLIHPIYVIKYFGFVAPAVALMAFDPKKARWKRAVILVGLTSLYLLTWSMAVDYSFIARRVTLF